MMVIQLTSNKTGNKTIFPANRCSWTQVDDAGSGLTIENVWYDTGAGRMYLSDEKAESVMLGFIGKSGKFIAI